MRDRGHEPSIVTLTLTAQSDASTRHREHPHVRTRTAHSISPAPTCAPQHVSSRAAQSWDGRNQLPPLGGGVCIRDEEPQVGQLLSAGRSDSACVSARVCLCVRGRVCMCAMASCWTACVRACVRASPNAISSDLLSPPLCLIFPIAPRHLRLR